MSDTLLPIPARLARSTWELLAIAARDAFGARTVTEGLTYAGFVHEAERAAARFAAAGLLAGSRVALLVPPGKTWLAAAFGAWRQGLVVCDEAALGATGGMTGAVVDSAGLQRLLVRPELPAHVFVTDATGPVPPGLLDFEADAAAAPAWDAVGTAPAFQRGPRAATHQQVLAELAGLQERLRLRAPARVLGPTRDDDASWPGAALLAPIAAGATIIFRPPEVAAAGASGLAEFIRTQMISHAFVDVPVLLHLATATAPQAEVPPRLQAAIDAIGGTLGGISEVLQAHLAADHGLVRALAFVRQRTSRAAPSALLGLVTTASDAVIADLQAAGLPVLRAWAPAGALGYVTLQDGAPPRADSVGRALRGVELAFGPVGEDGLAEIVVHGPVIGPEPLATGVRGRVDASLHVALEATRSHA